MPLFRSASGTVSVSTSRATIGTIRLLFTGACAISPPQATDAIEYGLRTKTKVCQALPEVPTIRRKTESRWHDAARLDSCGISGIPGILDGNSSRIGSIQVFPAPAKAPAGSWFCRIDFNLVRGLAISIRSTIKSPQCERVIRSRSRAGHFLCWRCSHCFSRVARCSWYHRTSSRVRAALCESLGISSTTSSCSLNLQH